MYTNYQTNYNMNKTNYINFTQHNMLIQGENLYSLHRELTIATLSLSNYNKFASANTERNIMNDINVNSTYTIEEYDSLDESMTQLLSAVFTITEKGIDEITEDDSDIMFMIANGEDVIMLALCNSALLFMNVNA